MTHRLRSLHDGLLVGIGTILADNPHLTVRNANGSNPQPIIVDSRLRFPLDANVLRYGRPPWIITAPDADAERERILANAGVSILRVRSYPDGFIDLPSILKAIRKKGIESLMVEGGASIITNFLRFRLINQIVLTLAPVFVGGIQAVWPLQFEFSDLPRLINIDYAMLGQDLVMRADLNWKSS
jgi:3,4-dihydroxy 2-butanone 4-phosphate synthase/GTP cyclohydrolase II